MVVSEQLRGLAGVAVAFLATWLLLLSMAETRERFGTVEHGVAWMPLKTFTERFDRVRTPLLFYGTINAVLGYVIGVRLVTKRTATFVAAGAAIGVLLAWLIPSPLPEKYGRAGENTIRLLELLAAFLGGCAGALIAEKTSRYDDEERPRKRRRAKKKR
jgi:hypothetical protein